MNKVPDICYLTTTDDVTFHHEHRYTNMSPYRKNVSFETISGLLLQKAEERIKAELRL